MIAKLIRLQAQIDLLRERMGLTERGAIIFLATGDASDDLVAVEADGFGGAVVKVVNGNYPVDFFTKHERSYAREIAALEAAESVIARVVDPIEVFHQVD